MSMKCICSVITRNYIDYLKVFCTSILKHNPGFNEDYIVFYESGALDKKDKLTLLKIYDKFIFKEVPLEKYKSLDSNHFVGTQYSKKIRRFAYYRLEMFNLKKYERVIYFDVDMVVVKNLDTLFNMQYDDGIIACEDLLVKHKKLKSKDYFSKHHKVQGGVIVAGKKCLTGSVYDDLINMLSDTRRFELADQSMFIEYFDGKSILKELDIKYNCGRKLIRDDIVKIDDVCVVHYPGSGKPNSQKRCKTYKYWLDIKNSL